MAKRHQKAVFKEQKQTKKWQSGTFVPQMHLLRLQAL